MIHFALLALEYSIQQKVSIIYYTLVVWREKENVRLFLSCY